MKEMNIVIVGHIDHGKSTLIGRLLFDSGCISDSKLRDIKSTCESLGRKFEFAYVTDYFKEEREKQVTIDSSQVFFKTKKRQYVIIDAPGHKDFIKNMITGASQADAGILIVDVVEGVKEQSKRHAYLLSVLGLKQVIVVINKMDLVSYDEAKFNKVKEELVEFLKLINVLPKCFIPISALNGDNVVSKSKCMLWYNGKSILEALDMFEVCKSSVRGLRFLVQDVYSFDKKKIFVGKVECGRIRKGQEVLVMPRNKVCRVLSIEVFNKKKSEAFAGESVGVVLSGEFVKRGDVLCDLGGGCGARDEFIGTIFWLSNDRFRMGDELFLRCGTQEVRCEIKRISKRIDSCSLDVIEENAIELREREVGEVVIKTAEPIVVEDFNDLQELGRFVLINDLSVVAAGIVKLR